MNSKLILILSIFSGLLLLIILLNIKWNYPFFFRGIIFCIIIFFIIFFFLFFIRKKINFDINKILLASTLSFFINYSVHVTILIHLERSFSVFLLSKMSATQKRYSEQDIKKLFYQNYFIKNKNIEKRLSEQVLINNIKKEDGMYSITQKGIIINKIFLIISKIYSIDTSNLVIKD